MTEKMYNDFVANVLPKIEEGLTITKDYFQDLFGRYIQYLIIMDAIWTVVGLALMVASVVAYIVLWKKSSSFIQELPSGRVDNTGMEMARSFGLLLLIPFIAGFAIFFVNIEDLIKDIYVPEIRVYEELSDHLK